MKAKAFTNFLGGLTGAMALSALHEAVRQIDQGAPRFDLVGEEGVNKMLEKTGSEPLSGGALHNAALVGDLISNALYYSMIGRKKKHLLFNGVLYGTIAGVGAVSLTRKMGLDAGHLTKTRRAKYMTVGYYVFGGLVTALIIKALRKGEN